MLKTPPSPQRALFFSLFFYLTLAVVNTAQMKLMPFASADGCSTALLMVVKYCLIAGFVLLLPNALRLGVANTVAPLDPDRARTYDPLLTLRFIAGFMVILGHGFFVFQPPQLKETVLQNGAWLLTSSPSAGLWIFYTLSGYLMGKGFYMQRYAADWSGAKHFYRNRFLRIAPLYWASVFIAALVLTPTIFQFQHWGDLIRVLTFDYNAEQTLNPDGPLFSITTEIQFYAVVPLLYLLTARMKTVSPYALMVLLLFVGTDYRGLGRSLWPEAYYRPLLSNLDIFLCGFLTNAVVTNALEKCVCIKRGVLIGFALLLALYAATSFMYARGEIRQELHWLNSNYIIMPALVTLATVAIIVCFELADFSAAPGLAIRLLKKTEILGTLTYAIYIWHYPVYEFFVRQISGSAPRHITADSWMNAAQLVALAYAVILAIAAAAHFLIEAPFQKKKRY